MGDNAIVDAFEMAASSYAVNHNFPNAHFYTPSTSTEQPSVSPESHEIPPEISPPRPDTTSIYPPPVPDADPERLRLLHSWYWAGYYTGLADGRRQAHK